MGCCNSKEKASAPMPIETSRRRLSLGAIDEKLSQSVAKNPNKSEDRSLLVELSAQTLIEIMAKHGRRDSWNVCSETDKERHRRQSFSGKTVREMGISIDGGERSRVGFSCKKGLKPEAPNQDSFFLIKAGSDLAIYGVFDGHGPSGHDVSDFVKNELPKVLLIDPNLLRDPSKALVASFEKTQRLLEQATELGQLSAQFSGTTATVILHLMATSEIYVAHCGDSRAVLARRMDSDAFNQDLSRRQSAQGAKIDHLGQGGQAPGPGGGGGGAVSKINSDTPSGSSYLVAVDLTHDHKPDNPLERERIERNGGRVVFDGFYNFRVYSKQGKYPGLNMSRALGDLAGYYDAGISPIPEIAYHKLTLNPDSPVAQQIPLGSNNNSNNNNNNGLGSNQTGGELMDETLPSGATVIPASRASDANASQTDGEFFETDSSDDEVGEGGVDNGNNDGNNIDGNGNMIEGGTDSINQVTSAGTVATTSNPNKGKNKIQKKNKKNKNKGANDGSGGAQPPGAIVEEQKGGMVAQSPVGPIEHPPDICPPEERPGTDEFLLLCSDGVWEFISSQESVEMTSTNLKNCQVVSETADILAKVSWDRWSKHMLGQVVDDITAVVVRL